MLYLFKRLNFTVFLLSCLIALTAGAAFSQERAFGLLAKDITDNNFVDAWKGCQEEARKTGDDCTLLGGQSPQAHIQALELKQILNEQYSGLAISVIDSELVGNTLRDSGTDLPIVTFDSNFNDHDKALSLSEIGINNVDFGKTLAEPALSHFPQGGQVCILSAQDTNLEQRVQGVRIALSGDASWPPGQRLSGQNGWVESRQCPLRSLDGNYQVGYQLSEVKPLVALSFERSLRYIKPDVFISVGIWPLVEPDTYRQAMLAYQQNTNNDLPLMVVAVGALLPEYDALMDDYLLNGLVGIDFPEIGRSALKVMRDIAEGTQASAVINVPTLTRFTE